MVTTTLPISIKKTLSRHHQNRITAIQNETGQWIYDVEIIKQLAGTFFSKLYTPEQWVHSPYTIRGCFLVICDDICLRLMSVVTYQEVRRTIFSMSSFNAPGDFILAFTKRNGVQLVCCCVLSLRIVLILIISLQRSTEPYWFLSLNLITQQASICFGRTAFAQFCIRR